MTYWARNGDAVEAVWRNFAQKAMQGNYVSDGCGVSVASSSTAIALNIAAGEARVGGDPVGVPSQTVTLPSGPAAGSGQLRKDLLYITATGSVESTQGDPDAPRPVTDAGDPYASRKLWSPSPPDGSLINGVPFYTVLLPEGAADSTDLANEDLTDYRIPPVEPGEHDHPDLALNRRTMVLQYGSAQYIKIATVNDGSNGLGGMRVRVWQGNNEVNATARTLDVEIVTRNSTFDVDARAFGSRSGAVDVILSRNNAGVSGTAQDLYHVYLHVPNSANAYVTTEHFGSSVGTTAVEDNLGVNDIRGTTVHHTGDESLGGETSLPKSPGAVRADVEGDVDVGSLTSASGTAGQVPTADATGSVAWANRVPKSGELVPVATQRFGATQIGGITSTTFTTATGTSERAVFPFAELDDMDMFEDREYFTLQGGFTNDTVGETTAGRLVWLGNVIEGSATSAQGTDIEWIRTNPPANNIFNAANGISLEARVTGGIGTIHAPSVTVYKKVV